MLGVFENVAMAWLMNGLIGGVVALAKGAWTFSWQHPILAGYVFFGLFILCFLAYGTLKRIWTSELHISYKVLIGFFLIVPFIFAYLFDIFIMRRLYGWVRFRVAPPPLREWRRALGAEGTFSSLIWDIKDTNAEAQWWHVILHKIDPAGH
jgi:hypothetical protein